MTPTSGSSEADGVHRLISRSFWASLRGGIGSDEAMSRAYFSGSIGLRRALAGIHFVKGGHRLIAKLGCSEHLSSSG